MCSFTVLGGGGGLKTGQYLVWPPFASRSATHLLRNMRWWSWMNGTKMGLRISSRYLCAFKMPSIKNDMVMQTDCCSGWSQTILEVKMLDVEVLGWCGYTWSAVVRLVGCTAKFSETPLETAYGREMNIQFNIQKVLDLWVQLMKNGGKNKSVAFIILFSIYRKTC